MESYVSLGISRRVVSEAADYFRCCLPEERPRPQVFSAVFESHRHFAKLEGPPTHNTKTNLDLNPVDDYGILRKKRTEYFLCRSNSLYFTAPKGSGFLELIVIIVLIANPNHT